MSTRTALAASPTSVRLSPIPTYLPAWQPHLLSGPSGVGKTAFCAWWATRLRDGLPIFGRQTSTPPWIGMIVTDREQEDTLQWYEVAGWPDIPCYSAVDDPEFDFFKLRSPKDALAKLNLTLDRLNIPSNGLLILDPVSAWAGGDMNRYDRVMPALGALSQLCLRRQITVLGLAHTAKQKADPKEGYKRAQDKILGSMALLGSTGTQMALEGPDQTQEEGVYRFTWNPHHAPSESFSLTRDDETGLFVPMDDVDARTQTEQEHAKLVAFLALLPVGEPLSTVAIVELASTALNCHRATVFRHLRRALALGLVEKCGHGQYRRRAVS